MLLFKKGAKDGLPDSNGPLCSRVPLDESTAEPTEKYPGARRISAGMKKRDPYDR